jgi:hypothetical protein
MFESFEYRIAQEYSKDMLRQAKQWRLVRSLEIPGRRKLDRRSTVGAWLLAVQRVVHNFAVTVSSIFPTDHQGLHSRGTR